MLLYTLYNIVKKKKNCIWFFLFFLRGLGGSRPVRPLNPSIPALLSLAAALEVVIMTASVAASIAGVAIKTTLGFQCLFPWTIDSSNKTHNAPITYHTMHHFVTKMRTHVVCTFLLQNGALWVICLMHCGICEMGLLRLNIYHVSIGTHWWNWNSQQGKSTDISAIGCLLWLFWSILTVLQHHISCVWQYPPPLKRSVLTHPKLVFIMMYTISNNCLPKANNLIAMPDELMHHSSLITWHNRYT